VERLLFGLNVSTSVAADGDPVADARRAEELGFDFVSASDHPEGSRPTSEVWTMLCFIAAATSRIAVATRVLGVPYRPPAMVAKMAETLDRLSGGRVILGLGGGHSDDEHRAFGLGVRTPREKTVGLAEAVTIIRGLWTEPAFSYNGELYRTEAADLEPKPGRRIPIWLGTFAPRGLAITGRLADGWIPSLGYAPADELPGMRARVLDAAAAAGRDPEAFTCALNVEVDLDAEAPVGSSVLAGTPEAVADRLRGFVDAGFAAFNFMPRGGDPRRQAERLAAEVLPLLQAR
jgi:alkanesulfonate monooxygenase SsuD/methylene tetrahydromethanopterin reductase-like flavin-dependent oxidoreductase (luciferase family)